MTSTFEGLNPQQKQAVEKVQGPVLVVAGPGSGKTRVLTQRVAHLVLDYGIPSYNILAVTFTNKAAREMRHRLEQLIGQQRLDQLNIGTFHAICTRILRREAEYLTFDRSFAIYDREDQVKVVKQALDALNLNDKLYRPASMLAAISRAKSEAQSPEEFPTPEYRLEVVKRVYQRYQEILRTNNALDFDDLLLEVLLLLRRNPEVLARYQRRFQYIMVDEFQDTNPLQYYLVQLLAKEHRNLFVVGDPDQSIYSWRNADIRNILNFEKDFPDAQVITLEQNYRSTQMILDAASALIAANQQRKPKKLWTENSKGTPIYIYEAYNEEDEAQFVVSEIARLQARKIATPGDCAVMYRTNAQSATLESAFVRKSIPYRLVGAVRFYERREVKDVLAYLRLLQNPADSVSLDRIINVPTRGIGSKSMQLISTVATRYRMSIIGVLRLLRDHPEAPEVESLDSRSARPLLSFLELIEAGIEHAASMDPANLIDWILSTINYREYLDREEDAEDRWENVMELRNVASQFTGLEPGESLAEFLSDVALVSDQDEVREGSHAVTLMTLHTAKGLEFPIVFITGVEEGILPHSRSAESPEELEEERRLAYVGITRARQLVYLLYAFRRTQWGRSEVRGPSRFLLDIPRSLVKNWTQQEETGGRAGAREELPKARVRVRDVQPGSARAGGGNQEKLHGKPADPFFRAGDKVIHPTFGEGVVVESKPSSDGDTEVTVAFPQGGVKRLLASYARLKKKGS
ncbi:MAG: AAA family ATPase [Chloroflexi bacterium]|nr:AAA family ATPase [Chloroflexota bacterium]